MAKTEVIATIKKKGLIAVVRAHDETEARSIIGACLDGGIEIIEITFTIPRAHDLLSKLGKTYQGSKVTIGAGTVLDSETARIAILEGAQFIVSPYMAPEVMTLSNRYRIPCFPGVSNVSEVVRGLELGADILKFFPGENMGPGFIKAMRGPLPQAELMPTGGVTLENVGEWIRAGAVALGVGSQLTKLGQGEKLVSITQRAEQFVKAISDARIGLV